MRERGANGSAARFVCHVALADRGRILFETTGIIEGEIAPEPRGTNGFGYDPIFYYPPYGCTLAELDLERKATRQPPRPGVRLAQLLSNSDLLNSLNPEP